MLVAFLCIAPWVTAAAMSADDEEIVVEKHYAISRTAPVEDGDMARLRFVVDSLVNATDLTEITVEGYSSPDGSQALNRRMALERAKGIRSYLTDRLGIAPELIVVSSHPEDWDGLRSAIAAADALPERDKILRTIDNTPDRDACERKLRHMSGGSVWRRLAREFLPPLRRTVVTFRFPAHSVEVIILEDEPGDDVVYPLPDYDVIEPFDVDEKEPDELIAEDAETETESEPPLNWYIKTNVPAWAMLWTNIAVEFDLARHWSAQLPVYYSGFNYFTGHRKFRTLTIMPEVRWWPRADNQGFFAGAHFGMGYYNVAFGGEKRYQDHNQNTPALGGGISVGYRLPISRNGRWHLEFSIGGGIYRLDYDIYNNYINGLLVDRRKRTFYGIDNAAISVAYRFDLAKQKGGKR